MDFNNDGLDDIIVGERNGFVNYFRRLPDGTLTSEGRIQSGSSDLDVGNNSAPFVYDWDGDGLLDLIVGREATSGGSIHLYLNQGTVENAVFDGYSPVMRGSSPVAYPRSIPHMEDMNGDGLIDLMVGEDYGHTYYLENTGSAGAPGFTTSSAITVNGNPFAWPSGQTDCTVYIDDWNEDGILDIIQGNYVKNVWVFLGNNVAVEDFNSQVVGAGVSVDLYSNPINGSLRYSISSELAVPISITLLCIDGRVAEQWDLGTLQGSSEHVHTISELPAGIYSLVVQAGSEMSYRQVAVIR